MDSKFQHIQTLYESFQTFLNETPGNEIPSTLIEIDTLISDILDGNISQDSKQRNAIEQAIFEKALGKKTSIDELLTDLSTRIGDILLQSPIDINQQLDIFVIKLQETILPPGKGELQDGDGETSWKEKPELTYSKYGRILFLLRENQVFADDIIVYQGKNKTNMMRETSYFVIQIPRLGKTIFVCDEYGEASFIVASIVAPETFTGTSKTEIREKLDAKKIIHSKAWEDQFLMTLFGEKQDEPMRGEKSSKNKIDVRQRQSYIDEIKKQCPTPEAFMGLTRIEKRAFELHGKGLTSIGSIILGGNTPRSTSGEFNPINYSTHHAEIARAIYGGGIDIIEFEFWNSDRWREEIKKQFPTPEKFMGLSSREKGEFKLYGKGLTFIGSIILGGNTPKSNDGTFNPTYYLTHHAEVARVIYGEGIDIIECESWNSERWRGKIKKQFPTPEKFMGLTRIEKGDFKLYGKGLISIGSIILGGNTPRSTSGEFNPINYSTHHAEIARAIYGE